MAQPALAETPAKPVPAPAASTVATPRAEAPRLTSAAIAAQLSGDSGKRDELLQQAVKVDPNYSLAHWQRGEVRFAGKWRSLEQIQEQVANSPRHQEYAAKLAEMNGAPADHEELAQWCQWQGLENEERYHWANVLHANPEHRLARTRLNLRPYRGGLYTDERIQANERQRADAKATLTKMRPVYAALCRSVIDGKGSDRELALIKLKQVEDISHIPALEESVAALARSAPDAVALELYLAIIESLAQIDDPQSTHRLLDYAIFAETDVVRHAAARALKPRPVTDYVPQLMGALTAPIESEINAFTLPNGSVMYDENYFQFGPLADYTVSRTHTQTVQQRGGALGPGGGPGPNTLRQHTNLQYASQARAASAKQQVAVANELSTIRNARIREVLANVFDDDLGEDPRAYWQAWTEYNELYVEEHPLVSLVNESSHQFIPTMSCFAAGTSIWTQAGPRPIEQLAVGDMVLSQNTSTGELAFRPVIGRTVRPPSKMVQVEAAGSPIVSTLGHRFWVNGQGWVMAKFLAADMVVQSVGNAATVAGIQALPPEEETEAYNLVIDDFHTYFVGDAKLLVHDNSCPQPTASKIPGHAAVKGILPADEVVSHVSR